MELQGSLPCSQEPSTGPYPEPDEFSPYQPNLFPYTLMLFQMLELNSVARWVD
jgi:hypothetical protein